MPPELQARSLVIIRHGETTWNRERRIMGDADVPLSEPGRWQCAAAAAVLTGFEIDRIVTSPLTRAVETAELISEVLDVPVATDEDLVEVRFGHWQGKTYEEIIRDPACERFFQDPESNPTPGGETIVDVQNRGLAALDRAAPGRRTLFVSHGDIIRSTLCHYLRMPVSEFRRIRVDNCGMSGVIARGAATEVKFLNVLADADRAWVPSHWNKAT
jgi:broad specificity phosphatase PhoE